MYISNYIINSTVNCEITPHCIIPSNSCIYLSSDHEYESSQHHISVVLPAIPTEPSGPIQYGPCPVVYPSNPLNRTPRPTDRPSSNTHISSPIARGSAPTPIVRLNPVLQPAAQGSHCIALTVIHEIRYTSYRTVQYVSVRCSML